MPRMLALPIALAAVLASSACASAGDPSGTAPETPDASTTQSQTAPSPSTTASGGAAERGEPSESGEATASDGASESGTAAPEATESTLIRPHTYAPTDPVVRRDPGQPGLPAASGASVDDVLRLGAVASWLARPDWIALSLPATSTCWALAAEPVLESPTRIVVDFEPPSEPCGPPDRARTYEVPVPDGVDARADLHLAVVGLEQEFTLTLPGH